MDNTPWIRIIGLVCIAFIFVYTQDADFNDQYTQTLPEAIDELKQYQKMVRQ